MAIVSLVVVLALCLAGICALSMQLRCVDAAREAARLAARGDTGTALRVARAIAPPAARVRLRRDGELVLVSVVARSKLLPELAISAEAVAVAEPG
ncbi:TadE family type IV pilus minor pilin [Mycobacterium ulcerans]|uniref:TadE family type IV pilus minor pilin n=1 Tax=Mycobacterium ulcerans TaxID=1809 RepID=UPI0023EE8AF0|nr:TadE family type IV pilus minor pilin [Mycobacterium ulcerans]